MGGLLPVYNVATWPILPQAERLLLLRDWNATKADDPQDQCVHQLVEAQAERTPEATALLFEGQSLSCRELNTRANRLAHHLMALGIRPDDRVAIGVEQSLEMVVGLLAILKAAASAQGLRGGSGTHHGQDADGSVREQGALQFQSATTNNRA